MNMDLFWAEILYDDPLDVQFLAWAQAQYLPVNQQQLALFNAFNSPLHVVGDWLSQLCDDFFIRSIDGYMSISFVFLNSSRRIWYYMHQFDKRKWVATPETSIFSCTMWPLLIVKATSLMRESMSLSCRVPDPTVGMKHQTQQYYFSIFIKWKMASESHVKLKAKRRHKQTAVYGEVTILCALILGAAMVYPWA